VSFSYFQILSLEAGITIEPNCYVLFFQLSIFYLGYTQFGLPFSVVLTGLLDLCSTHPDNKLSGYFRMSLTGQNDASPNSWIRPSCILDTISQIFSGSSYKSRPARS
jgi:hypothetical protein